MRIGTQHDPFATQRHLSLSTGALTTAIQRLSSGLRVNSAADDAAGLAIAERFTAQVRGLHQAARNVNDALSLAQTAESALASVGANLQRIRELAVQAANAAYSAADRAAMQAEVAGLVAEVNRVAEHAEFNGIKLLDGSFGNASIQVGAHSAQTISIGTLASMKGDDLKKITITLNAATATGTAVTGALASGDLVLNGVTVGATTAGASMGQGSASAYAVAAAINQVQSSSGVGAVATTLLTGLPPLAFAPLAANSFSINGVAVGAVAAGAGAVTQGQNVAQAINLVSDLTGVSASASTTTGALTLTSVDGRDIGIGMVGTCADPLDAILKRNALLDQTGLDSAWVGTPTYTSGGIGPRTEGTSHSGTVATIGATVGTVSNLQYGIDGGPLVSLAPILFPGESTANAQALVDAIGLPGIVSQSNGQLTVSGGHVIRFAIDSFAPDLATAVANQTALSTLTGISTRQLGSQLVGDLSPTGRPAVDIYSKGQVTLTGATANSLQVSGAGVAHAGLTAGSIPTTTTVEAENLSQMDISSTNGANQMLAFIDTPLATVSSARAHLGALQNRFESVVDNLRLTGENLSTARARIMDADLAQETARLTRSQILRQAGVAMAALANQVPQNVLVLLR